MSNFAGKDLSGNRYYKTSAGKRFVRYSEAKDPSGIPSGWYIWLHYITDQVPSNELSFTWEKEKKPNLTGTVGAYKPDGHILNDPQKINESCIYHAWKP